MKVLKLKKSKTTAKSRQIRFRLAEEFAQRLDALMARCEAKEIEFPFNSLLAAPAEKVIALGEKDLADFESNGDVEYSTAPEH